MHPKKVVITREPPKFIMAFMFLLFALMIWIATIQFLKNDKIYQDSVRKEEMLSYIVDLYADAIHSPDPPQLLPNGNLGKDIFLFQLNSEGKIVSGNLGILTSSKEEGNPQRQMILLAETKGYGYIIYNTQNGKRIAYLRWDPKSSHVIGGSINY